MLVAATLAAPLLAAPAPVSAEGLFDFFFGGMQQQRPQREVPQQASSYADPFTGQQNATPQYLPSQLRTQNAGPEPPAAAERVGGTYCGDAAFCWPVKGSA